MIFNEEKRAFKHDFKGGEIILHVNKQPLMDKQDSLKKKNQYIMWVLLENHESY